MRTTLNPPFEISRSATVMGSPKGNPSKSTVFVSFHSKQKCRKMCHGEGRR